MIPATEAIVEKILIAEEGFRANLYDDATGQPIKPGSIVKGHPTVGFGCALDVSPLTEDEALYLLRNRYRAALAALPYALRWVGDLDPPRAAVVVAMAYQMGPAGLQGFTKFLTYCLQNDWGNAADEMLDSEWARQTPSRAKRMAAIMRTGNVGSGSV